MRWVMLCGLMVATLILAPLLAPAAKTSSKAPAKGVPREADAVLGGPSIAVGPVQFTVPPRWLKEQPRNDARVGQWRIPALAAGVGEGEAVAFYFGPQSGGSVRENMDAWISTMTNGSGQPAPAEQKRRMSAGLKISQVTIFGTFSEAVPLAGLPPVACPGFGLVGAVIESPQGNIYWRFTGPEALVTANLSLFDKVLDSVKPLPAP